MTSIRRALLWSLLPAIFLLLALAVIVVLHEVRDEINELFDVQLAQAAHAVPVLYESAPRETAEDDPSKDMVIAVWEASATNPRYYSRARGPLARLSQPGFATVLIAGEPWRCYQLAASARTVLVGQPLAIRNEAVVEIGARILLPVLVLIPLIVLTVLVLVKRGLRPLTRFATELHARSPKALGSIDLQSMPAELLPVASAMNDLLARLSAALEAQQVFVADATHELLTPLTALQVQVQMLERARSEERRAQTTRDVRESLERCITLARQLLALARHSTDLPPEIRRSIRLAAIVQAAVSEVLPKAHVRGIDLGVASEGDGQVSGDERALQTLIGNLIDNAVKYAPVGGRVDVTIGVRDGRSLLTVSDNGPGIPAAEQTRVFDRFYRSSTVDTDGSGLGLAIAREIAARHDATIALRSPGRLGGLDAEVLFGGSASMSALTEVT